MKRWRWHILLFLAAYLVTLVATLPAALAMRWAEPVLAKMAQRPQLQGVSGSIWSGRVAQASYRGLTLGELKWELSPWRLLLGRIAVEVALTPPSGHLEGELSRGFGGEALRLRALEGQLPAAVLKQLAPSLPLAPAGSLALNLDEVVMEGAKLRSVQGRIVWNKGGVTAPMALEFGDLVAEFTTAEGGISGSIKDGGGPLQLEAELTLAGDGTYSLTGKSSARAGAAPALKSSLSLLGQPDVRGMIPFRFNGRL